MPAGTGEGAGGGSGEHAENQGHNCPEVTNCSPAAGGPVIHPLSASWTLSCGLQTKPESDSAQGIITSQAGRKEFGAD